MSRYDRWVWRTTLKRACLHIVYTMVALMVLVYWIGEVWI